MHFLLDKDILCLLIRIIQNHTGWVNENQNATGSILYKKKYK